MCCDYDSPEDVIARVQSAAADRVRQEYSDAAMRVFYKAVYGDQSGPTPAAKALTQLVSIITGWSLDSIYNQIKYMHDTELHTSRNEAEHEEYKRRGWLP